MKQEEVSILREKLNRADAINEELAQNKLLIDDIERKIDHINSNGHNKSCRFLERTLTEQDVTIPILESTKNILEARNKNLEKEFKAL